ncbi:hypothetical protein AAF712_015878 [Marasmius tenuissimus]|uniref:Uncharacterized protein n=1 Tax=Marasmius tenuissimus TaxID=585030 RepID=A0ABR2Z731_9AGAR|nr:hypothetical protein PM082_011431 [Marasmius tenuissimus]
MIHWHLRRQILLIGTIGVVNQKLNKDSTPDSDTKLQPLAKKTKPKDSALNSDTEFQPLTKKTKPKSDAINRLLARANQLSFRAADNESKAGYCPSQATSRKSAAGSTSNWSSKTASSSKGKACAVPERFKFGRVLVFPNGCRRKKTNIRAFNMVILIDIDFTLY